MTASVVHAIVAIVGALGLWNGPVGGEDDHRRRGRERPQGPRCPLRPAERDGGHRVIVLAAIGLCHTTPTESERPFMRKTVAVPGAGPARRLVRTAVALALAMAAVGGGAALASVPGGAGCPDPSNTDCPSPPTESQFVHLTATTTTYFSPGPIRTELLGQILGRAGAATRRCWLGQQSGEPDPSRPRRESVL